MSLTERYDAWLHTRLFNPAFTWLQKWFHVNRFQIIYGFLAGMYAAGTLIGLIFLTYAAFDQSIPGVAGLRSMIGSFVLLFVATTVWAKDAVRTFRDLKRASDRFEETGQSRVSHFLYRKIIDERGARVNRNAIVTCTSLFLLLNAWMNPFTDSRNGCLLSAAIFVAWATLAHVWDVDGVKPEDRINVFNPQSDAA